MAKGGAGSARGKDEAKQPQVHTDQRSTRSGRGRPKGSITSSKAPSIPDYGSQDDREEENREDQRSEVEEEREEPEPAPSRSPRRKRNQEHLPYENPVIKPLNAIVSVILLPSLLFYLFICVEFNEGNLILMKPSEILKMEAAVDWFSENLWKHFSVFYRPSIQSMMIYGGYALMMLAVSAICPSMLSQKEINYNNYLLSWLITIGVVLTVHYNNILSLELLNDNYAELMMVANIAAIIFAVIAFTMNNTSSDKFDNFFMKYVYGTKNLENVELKSFIAMRMGLLFFFVLSLALTQTQKNSRSALFILAYTFIIVHYFFKSAEIFAKKERTQEEKIGWVWIWKMMVLLPFGGTLILRHLYHNRITEDSKFVWFHAAVFALGYYLFDSSNAQLAFFRRDIKTVNIPVMPYSKVDEAAWVPAEERDANGTWAAAIMVDGWRRYVRYPELLGACLMAISFGMTGCIQSLIPLAVPLAVIYHILKRINESENLSKTKYGEDWESYCDIVRWKLVPGMY